MATKMMRKITRILIPILMLIGSLPILKLAAFHWWASGFPDSSTSAWHEKWGNIFFVAWVVVLGLGASSIYWLRPKHGMNAANHTSEDIVAKRAESSR